MIKKYSFVRFVRFVQFGYAKGSVRGHFLLVCFAEKSFKSFKSFLFNFDFVELKVRKLRKADAVGI